MTGSALLRPLLFVSVVLLGVLLHPVGSHAGDQLARTNGLARTDSLKLTDAEARARLKTAGITWWSSGNCTNRQRTDCTSFEQIRRTTIAGVVTLHKSSACPIMVTGGTEAGHGTGTYTHWNGWKVDIALNDCVNAYVRSWFSDAGYISGWGHQYRAPSGNLYTNEGDHWDILYYSCGGCDPEPAPPKPVVLPSAPASPSAGSAAAASASSPAAPYATSPAPTASPGTVTSPDTIPPASTALPGTATQPGTLASPGAASTSAVASPDTTAAGAPSPGSPPFTEAPTGTAAPTGTEADPLPTVEPPAPEPTGPPPSPPGVLSVAG